MLSPMGNMTQIGRARTAQDAMAQPDAQPGQPPQPDPLAYDQVAETAAEKTVEKVSTYGGFAAIGDMFVLGIGLGVIGGIGGFLSWMGRITGIGFIENAGKSVKGMSTRGQGLREVSFRKAGNIFSGFIGLFEGLFNKIGLKSVGGMFGSLKGAVRGVEDGFWKMAGQGAEAAMGTLGKGVEAAFGKQLAARGDRLIRLAGERVSKATQHLTPMEEALGKLASAPQVAEHHGKLTQITKDLRGALEAKDFTKAKELRTQLGETIMKAEQATGLSKEHGKAMGQLSKHAGKLVTQAEKLEDLHATGLGYKSPAKSLAGMPDRIAKMPIVEGAWKTGMIAGTGLQTHLTIKGIGKELHSLRQLVADSTGKDIKSVSTYTALFGNAPNEMVKRARTQLVKHYGPETLFNAVNLGTMPLFLKRHISPVVMFGVMGLQMGQAITRSMAAGNELLPAYTAINKQLDQQGTADWKLYARLIASASDEAGKAGGPESRLVQVMAQRYAQAKTKPIDLLREIENKGAFDKHAAEVQEEIKAIEQKKIEAARDNAKGGKKDKKDSAPEAPQQASEASDSDKTEAPAIAAKAAPGVTEFSTRSMAAKETDTQSPVNSPASSLLAGTPPTALSAASLQHDGVVNGAQLAL